jgi:hypothetical protein
MVPQAKQIYHPFTECAEQMRASRRSTKLREFTAVLPVRDTDEEYSMLTDSLASCVAMYPSEVLLCLDAPSTRLEERARRVAEFFHYSGLRVLTVPPSRDWNFQLAKIVWTAYRQAENDIILSFDVDVVLIERPLLRGLELVGQDNVGVVTFRKLGRTRSPQDFVRMFFYATWHPAGSAGLYFLHKKVYFDIVREDDIRRIVNGIDTLLFQRMLKLEKYRLVPLPDFACISLRAANEELVWRQLQTGIWLGASQNSNLLMPLVTSIMWAMPGVLKGFFLARDNPMHPSVRLAAQSRDISDYIYLGKDSLRELVSDSGR